MMGHPVECVNFYTLKRTYLEEEYVYHFIYISLES